jgi:hypothetical protein
MFEKKAEEPKKIHFQAATNAALSGHPWQFARTAHHVSGLPHAL